MNKESVRTSQRTNGASIINNNALHLGKEIIDVFFYYMKHTHTLRQQVEELLALIWRYVRKAGAFKVLILTQIFRFFEICYRQG